MRPAAILKIELDMSKYPDGCNVMAADRGGHNKPTDLNRFWVKGHVT